MESCLVFVYSVQDSLRLQSSLKPISLSTRAFPIFPLSTLTLFLSPHYAARLRTDFASTSFLWRAGTSLPAGTAFLWRAVSWERGRQHFPQYFFVKTLLMHRRVQKIHFSCLFLSIVVRVFVFVFWPKMAKSVAHLIILIHMYIWVLVLKSFFSWFSTFFFLCKTDLFSKMLSFSLAC